MRDYLAWRLAFGVTTPSTNTVVQPEYDDMRPAGVTNHLARMVIADDPVTSDADFEKQLEAIDKSLEDAVDRVMDAKPNAFILGISALSVWGGTLEWGEELKRRVRKVAGWDIPVAIASDAVAAGLKAHGIKRKIAIMEPYYPCIEPRLNAVLGAYGYEVVRYLPHARQEPGLLFRADRPGHDQGGPLDRRAGCRGDRGLRRQPALRPAGRRSRTVARQARAADQCDDLLARAQDQRASPTRSTATARCWRDFRGTRHRRDASRATSGQRAAAKPGHGPSTQTCQSQAGRRHEAGELQRPYCGRAEQPQRPGGRTGRRHGRHARLRATSQ